MDKQGRFQLAGLIALLTVLTGCSGQPSDADSTTLHRGNRIEPQSLDPALAYISDESTIVSDLFTGLYQPGPDGRPIPGLAETVEVSSDGLTWRFTLRDALWSDGVPVTAGDVVAGLRRALDPATLNPYPSVLFVLSNGLEVNEGTVPVEALGAEAPDDQTVILRLVYPAPYLPSVLMRYGLPLPRHAFAVHGDAWMRPENIVVNGPFRLAEWRSNNFIHLVANPGFFEADAVCLSDVYYYPTVDTAAAERRVRNNELDLNVELSGSNLDFLRARYPDMVRIGPGLVVREINFNTRVAPFDDVRVRTALSMAIDRRFLTQEVLAGADTPLWRVVPDGITNQPAGVGLRFADEPMEARRAEAARLLEAAGFGPDNPLRFTLYYQPAASWPRLVPVIQEDWALIAPWVQVEVQVRESQLHYNAMTVGDFGAATSGWIPDFDDPYGYLMQHETSAGPINFTKWNNGGYDALIQAGINTADPVRRTALLGEAEQLFLDGAASAPIFVENNKQLVGPRVTGWISNPLRINQSRWLCVTE